LVRLWLWPRFGVERGGGREHLRHGQVGQLGMYGQARVRKELIGVRPVPEAWPNLGAGEWMPAGRAALWCRSGPTFPTPV